MKVYNALPQRLNRLLIGSPVLPHSSNHPLPLSCNNISLIPAQIVIGRASISSVLPLFLTALTNCQAVPSFSHYSTDSLQALQQPSSRHISVNSCWIFFNQASNSTVFITLHRCTIRLTSGAFVPLLFPFFHLSDQFGPSYFSHISSIPPQILINHACIHALPLFYLSHTFVHTQ